MLFTKSFFGAIVLSASLIMQANAHAAFTGPNLVKTVQRKDATRGDCNKAKALTDPITADKSGKFTVSAVSFNNGSDGQTALKTAEVDASGEGKTFKDKVTIIKDGKPSGKPKQVDELTLQLSSGTKCAAGGCLVKLVSKSGFGNCVAVKQSGATTAAATPHAEANAGKNEKPMAESGKDKNGKNINIVNGKDNGKDNNHGKANSSGKANNDQGAAKQGGMRKSGHRKHKMGAKQGGKQGQQKSGNGQQQKSGNGQQQKKLPTQAPVLARPPNMDGASKNVPLPAAPAIAKPATPATPAPKLQRRYVPDFSSGSE